MIIKNLKIFQDNKTFKSGNLAFLDGKFVPEESVSDTEMMDGNGWFAIPGLIDIHFHGCMGDDFCDADLNGIARMAKYQACVGVTSICPATMTLSTEQLLDIMRVAKRYDSAQGAHFVGINMEGPFISEQKKGAQAADYIINCDVAFFRELQTQSGGLIKLVDIAPENEGAMEFIDQVKNDVVISIAHTTADYDTALQAFLRGASHVTHLYNAMPGLHHRNPGVVGAAYDAKNCFVELICDGIHVHPAMIRATFSMFGADRVIFISDSMRATGLKDGKYTLGGQDVFVEQSKATLQDGTIAGSATNLMDCLRFAVKQAKIPLEEAVACATQNPAKQIGIDQDYASLSVGKHADFVLLDDQLSLKAVYINGTQWKS